jgi:hypothetical protein
MGELDEQGNLPVTQVAQRLQQALDVEQVTKRFFNEFNEMRLAFTEQIEGIPSEHDRRWYASVLLNRILFIYFLQRKFILDGGDVLYLQHKLASSRAQESSAKHNDTYYSQFLKTLFFEGFALPEDQRSAAAKQLIGQIRYLNGGLFLPHAMEEKYGAAIRIPDAAFDALFRLLESYSWNLNDTPGGDDKEINPHVLGYIFEKYINQKEFGAYYTRPEITEYLCEQTIHRLIVDKLNQRWAEAAREQQLLAEAGVQTAPAASPIPQPPQRFETLEDVLRQLDAPLCRALLTEMLPSLKLLDPACGSGAFLVAAMKTLIEIYSAVIGQAEKLDDPTLNTWLAEMKRDHPSVEYFIKKRIIVDNLFGVDVMDEAVEIARLRLFLALVASVQRAEQLEPLPNIDFNILPGNSLIGLLRVDEATFNQRQAGPTANGDSLVGEQLGLGITTASRSYAEVLAEKNRLIASYRSNAQFGEHLKGLRREIEARRKDDAAVLNEILLNQFQGLGILFQQATWDEKKGAEGKPTKRAVALADVARLAPFHWGYEFDEVMNNPTPSPSPTGEGSQLGGFDAIITNPPWEIFKPQAKEFFAEYSDVVTKNSMTIKDFEKEQARLLKQRDVRAAWLEYSSRFPHVSAWYRSAPQFANQIAVVNGKKAGSDTNLYKLFVEQCFNLLREGGLCGIVIPSGIYTDLGAKQLREMLFTSTQVTGLFCFENRREIFENVHRSFKFVVLTFEKSGNTQSFPAAFMRHDVAELERFPNEGALPISVEMVHKLSPDSLSVMEFKSDVDVRIAERMLRFPLLGEQLDSVWNLRLTREFDMTNDSHLFKPQPAKGRLPLYEGKMIHQFDAHFAEPRYWVDEKEGRKALLGKEADARQILNYQNYRMAFRDIAASTNERSAIGTLLPRNVFAGNTLPLHFSLYADAPDGNDLLSVLCIFNSFVFDWLIRQKITSHLNLFYVYQMPAPRLSKRDRLFQLFAARAAQLICTTPEFDDLRKTVEADLGLVITPATDQDTRAQLRAELDGMVAHLYGLSQDEFAHVLSTFPLVAQATKDAALAEYAKLADDAEFQQAVAQAIESQAALRANAAAAPVAPASPVTLASDEAEPPQLPAPDTASRRAIDDFSKDELMAAVRDAFDAGNPLTRDEVVRGAARALGFERAGARIAEVLDDAIRTAVRRGFVEREGEALRLFGKALDEWDRDWVKDQFLAAIGRAWIEREDAIKAFSLWLGYRRVGSVFEEVTRSVMNGLIREGRLEGRGNAVRRLGAS